MLKTVFGLVRVWKPNQPSPYFRVSASLWLPKHTIKWQTLENSQGDPKSIKNHLLSSTCSAGIYGPRVGQPYETNDWADITILHITNFAITEWWVTTQQLKINK